MKEAIQKAIEGGWNDGVFALKLIGDYEEENKPMLARLHMEAVTLMPLFWQSLGKSLGWEKNIFDIPVTGLNWIYYVRGVHAFDLQMRTDEWRYHWHSFIDHLASGKNAESFFEDLLNK